MCTFENQARVRADQDVVSTNVGRQGAPGGAVVLEPGGLHLMLNSLQKRLVEGDAFPMTLMFEHAGEVHVYVMVAGMGAKQMPRHHHDHSDDPAHDDHRDYHDHDE